MIQKMKIFLYFKCKIHNEGLFLTWSIHGANFIVLRPALHDFPQINPKNTSNIWLFWQRKTFGTKFGLCCTIQKRFEHIWIKNGHAVRFYFGHFLQTLISLISLLAPLCSAASLSSSYWIRLRRQCQLLPTRSLWKTSAHHQSTTPKKESESLKDISEGTKSVFWKFSLWESNHCWAKNWPFWSEGSIKLYCCSVRCSLICKSHLSMRSPAQRSFFLLEYYQRLLHFLFRFFSLFFQLV